MNPVIDRFYYVYILQSLKSGKWYTEYTNDLRKPFKDHEQNKSAAREKYLKSGMGKRYLKTD